MKTEEILDLFAPKNRDVEVILKIFNDFIRPLSRKSYPKAEKKIQARLKTYTRDQIIEALNNFSQDEWRMENNREYSLDWYFHSDERIETFLELGRKNKPSWKIGNKIYYSQAELEEAEKKGEIKYDNKSSRFVSAD